MDCELFSVNLAAEYIFQIDVSNRDDLEDFFYESFLQNICNANTNNIAVDRH